jgi:hypothetical protein
MARKPLLVSQIQLKSRYRLPLDLWGILSLIAQCGARATRNEDIVQNLDRFQNYVLV